MDEDTFHSECGMCGKIFEPHADSYVEVGYTPMLTEEDEGFNLTRDDLETLSAYQLQENGLDSDAVHDLLQAKENDMIVTGGTAICDACLKEHFGV